MHRVDTSSAIAVMPSPKPAGSPGFFTEGDAAAGSKATYPGPDFFNSIQEELAAVVTGSGAALSKTDNGQILKAIRDIASGAAIAGASKALIARNNAITPNSRVDVTADEVVVKDSNNYPKLLTAFSVIVDIAVSGVNGLDTGAEAINTWYYLYAIARDDGVSAGLLSASATAPQLPAGYTHKARIGVVRNDPGGNFVAFYQAGDRWYYKSEQTVLSAGTATVETSVSLADFVPPVAVSKEAFLAISQSGSDVGGGINHTLGMRIFTGLNFFSSQFNGTAGGGGESIFYEFTIPLVQASYWYLLTITAGSSNATTQKIIGFSLR